MVAEKLYDYHVPILRHLFETRRLTWSEAFKFVESNFNILNGINVRTLRRFCKKRNINYNAKASYAEINTLIVRGVTELVGHYGYRGIKTFVDLHKPALVSTCVSEKTIRRILPAVAPEYYIQRTLNINQHLNPAIYYAPHFGYNMHMDQAEKLNMYGVTIVMAVDGHSRIVIGFSVAPYKNNYTIYREVFIPIVTNFGLFERLITDHGTENFLSIFVQYDLRKQLDPDRKAFLQVKSTHNTRIERMWVEVNKHVLYPLKRALLELEMEGTVNRQDDVIMFSVSSCAIMLAKHALQNFVVVWNNHYIRGFGKPLKHMNPCGCVRLPLGVLQSPEVAGGLYIQQGGHLTPEHVFGVDILDGSAVRQRLRDGHFNFAYGRDRVGVIFSSVVHKTIGPLRTMIKDHISTTRYYSII